MGILGHIFVIILFLVSSVSAQLSPGDLSVYHESLEGLTNCVNCHELGEGPSAAKCLECHQTLRRRIESQKGYHNQTVNIEGGICFQCHNEHAGKDFELIVWPEKQMQKFDHALTGYDLIGKHATISCRDCHHPGNMSKDIVTREDINSVRTFLGLETQCLTCHYDEHRGQLTSDCAECHTMNGWKKDNRFDHNAARFLLTGKHTQVQCLKCHPLIADSKSASGNDSIYVQYTNLTFKNCTSCHPDKHDGKFGDDCTRCHTTAGWKILDERNVDHSRTNFPLIGKHGSVACDKCHMPNVRFVKKDYDECIDCHADIHEGQFASRMIGSGCENCHNEFGFLPSLFSRTRHNEETEFNLVGSHLAQPCFVCHMMVSNNEGIMYRLFLSDARNCRDCHTDPHRNQFARSDNSTECQICHNPDKWTAVLFDHNKQSKYPLEGAHRKVNCDGCHKIETDESGSFVRYKPIARECRDCHQGSIENLKPLEG